MKSKSIPDGVFLLKTVDGYALLIADYAISLYTYGYDYMPKMRLVKTYTNCDVPSKIQIYKLWKDDKIYWIDHFHMNATALYNSAKEITNQFKFYKSKMKKSVVYEQEDNDIFIILLLYFNKRGLHSPLTKYETLTHLGDLILRNSHCTTQWRNTNVRKMYCRYKTDLDIFENHVHK